MYTLFDFLPSGNGYKVRLVLCYLDIPFDYIEVDITSGGTRTRDFLSKNPNGKIPTLEYAPGEYLFESNAIMHYLADGTDLLPEDRIDRAKVMQWLFFEQYSHEPYIAVSRFLLTHGERNDETRAVVASKRSGGLAALDVMEKHLKRHDFFAGENFSIADIGLYAYTHVASEGGFDLSPYPAINNWLRRVSAQPRHCKITDNFRNNQN